MPDSPRWCETCRTYGDHHTDRHPHVPASKRRMDISLRIGELERGICEGTRPSVDARGELARLRREIGIDR